MTRPDGEIPNVRDNAAAKRHRRKPTKADLVAALQRAEQALFAEPGVYTYTEPVRIEVRIYAR